jgi:hypothetical protein
VYLRRLLSVPLTLTACVAADTPSGARDATFGVYQTVVASLTPQNRQAPRGWLADSTLDIRPLIGESADWFAHEVPSDYREAMFALLHDSAPESPLPSELALPPGVEWRSSMSESIALETRFALSRVGFSPDSSRAVLLKSYHCGPLCAGVWFELYARTALNTWQRTGVLPVSSS